MTTETNTELRDIVLEAYADAGDRLGAVNALVDRWFEDSRFRRLAAQEVVREGIGNVVSHLLSRIKGVATNGNGQNDDTIIETLRERGQFGEAHAGRSHATQVAAAIFLYPLYGGKPIGYAVRPEILKSAEQHTKQASGHQNAAKWQELVATALPDDATIPMACLDAKKMQALLEQASEE